jgi:hypothetical protein
MSATRRRATAAATSAGHVDLDGRACLVVRIVDI